VVYMKKLIAGFLCLIFILISADLSFSQESEEEPGERFAAVTIFDVPLHVRDKVIPYIIEYVEPGMRLNPNVVTFRVLIHRWGSNGSQMIYYREYENFGDINAECGAPCEEYRKEHPAPKEGEEGYEDYKEAQKLYDKYFSDHHDEIYWIPMEAAKTEGKNIGTVGPNDN
ncbi:MAG: hypothetical protein R3211_11880, partial [Balneolaceae bacterium]|nr:hypothetical protein [Balneolaceae bacterium]